MTRRGLGPWGSSKGGGTRFAFDGEVGRSSRSDFSSSWTGGGVYGNFLGLGTGGDCSAKRSGPSTPLGTVAVAFSPTPVSSPESSFPTDRESEGDFTFRDDRLAVFRWEVAGASISPPSTSSVFSRVGSSRGSAFILTATDRDGRPLRPEVDGFEELLRFLVECVREVGLAVTCSSVSSSAAATCSLPIFPLAEEGATSLEVALRVRGAMTGLVSSSSSSSWTPSSSYD